MLISGVHLIFFSPKEAQLQLGDYKKKYSQSQLRYGEIAKKNKNKQTNNEEMLGN